VKQARTSAESVEVEVEPLAVVEVIAAGLG
jgi:hypothetical protein